MNTQVRILVSRHACFKDAKGIRITNIAEFCWPIKRSPLDDVGGLIFMDSEANHKLLTFLSAFCENPYPMSASPLG